MTDGEGQAHRCLVRRLLADLDTRQEGGAGMLSEQFSLQLPQLELLMTAGGIAHLEEEGGGDATDATVAPTPLLPLGPKPALLDGESLTNVVKPVAYTLSRKRGGGVEFNGALHITNFRLILQRTGASQDAFGADDHSLEWVSFPMGCIKAVTQADDDSLAITITAKDLRSCRMRMLSSNALFVSTLTQIIGSMAVFTQTSPERAFAVGHAAAAERRRSADRAALPPKAAPAASKDNNAGVDIHGNSKDGWLVYDEEAEFVRQGLIKPKSLNSPARSGAGRETNTAAPPPPTSSTGSAKDEPPPWRLFHNRSHGVVPTYPLHFVVPAVMTDSDVRAVAAYRSKGRLPAVTWMDPATKAVLVRSAQPLAGLGGKSCAQDARLLGLFGSKGKPAETPFQIGAAAAAVAAAADGGGIPASDSSSRRRRRARGSVSLPPQPRNNRRGSTGSGGDGFSSQDEDEDDGLEPGVVRRPNTQGNAGGVGGNTGGARGDRGESFLEAFGISSSWTPPWSTTKVAVQKPGPTKTRPDHERRKPAEDGAKRASPPRPRQQQEGKRREEGVGRPQRGPGRAATAAAAATGAGAQDSRDRGRGRGREKGVPDRKAPQLCVLDARTAVAALGNQLVGKGIETGAGYGNSTQLVFSGIGNVHAVKDAFEEMRDSLDPVKTESKMDRWRDDSSKMVAKRVSRSLGFARTMDLKYALGDQLGGDQLEEATPYTQWPRLLRQILGASLLAARLLRLKGCSVLVHCSDGWDRTPQICSTVQLLLDPYYRTLEGFCILIEKEWLSFGHKFWARCMGGSHENAPDEPAAGAAAGDGKTSGPSSSSSSSPSSPSSSSSSSSAPPVPSMKEFVGGQVREFDELSPVFLQFLDLVHNVVAQFPAAFEFTEKLLTFVAEHTFSGLYGTFLCDTERRRARLKMKQKTLSVWTVVLNNREAFVHAGYKETQEPLWPSLAPTKIRLWERQHCRMPSLRPHHLCNGSEAAAAADLWEDNVALTCRLERGEFHLGVVRDEGGSRGEGGGADLV